jgi:hypothetical protein
MNIEDDLAAILRAIQLLDDALIAAPTEERWISYMHSVRLRNRANHLNQLASLYGRGEE